jgi:hypothetical protein
MSKTWLKADLVIINPKSAGWMIANIEPSISCEPPDFDSESVIWPNTGKRCVLVDLLFGV